MKLQTIFDQLTTGELSQLSFGGQEMSVINDRNYEKVVPHVNVALTALHSRFALRNRSLTLEVTPGKHEYLLDNAFAVGNTKSREAERYILDTSDDPFENDVLKVEKVITEDDEVYRLNDGSRYAITTPSANILKLPKTIPKDLQSDTLEVQYRANHPEIVIGLGYFDPARVEVDLPYAYLQALCFYIASRVHNPMGMQQDFNAGNNFYAKYENECQILEAKGLYIDAGHNTDRFQRGGWV